MVPVDSKASSDKRELNGIKWINSGTVCVSTALGSSSAGWKDPVWLCVQVKLRHGVVAVGTAAAAAGGNGAPQPPLSPLSFGHTLVFDATHGGPLSLRGGLQPLMQALTPAPPLFSSQPNVNGPPPPPPPRHGHGHASQANGHAPSNASGAANAAATNNADAAAADDDDTSAVAPWFFETDKEQKMKQTKKRNRNRKKKQTNKKQTFRRRWLTEFSFVFFLSVSLISDFNEDSARRESSIGFTFFSILWKTSATDIEDHRWFFVGNTGAVGVSSDRVVFVFFASLVCFFFAESTPFFLFSFDLFLFCFLLFLKRYGWPPPLGRSRSSQKKKKNNKKKMNEKMDQSRIRF